MKTLFLRLWCAWQALCGRSLPLYVKLLEGKSVAVNLTVYGGIITGSGGAVSQCEVYPNRKPEHGIEIYGPDSICEFCFEDGSPEEADAAFNAPGGLCFDLGKR